MLRKLIKAAIKIPVGIGKKSNILETKSNLNFFLFTDTNIPTCFNILPPFSRLFNGELTQKNKSTSNRIKVRSHILFYIGTIHTGKDAFPSVLLLKAFKSLH